MDIGWPEFLVLAGLAVVIFGPDKLPKVAADAGRLVRRLRELADSARTDLADAAGVDVRGIATDLRSVADLHPKKLLGSAVAEFADVTDAAKSAGQSAGGDEPGRNPARSPGHDPDAT